MGNTLALSDPLLDKALDKFWETVPSVWGSVRAYIRSLATEKYEISVEQFHILRCIRKGHHTISEIADVRNLSRPAISQGADALVSRGLLVRTQNDSDRRFINLELTAKGNTLLDDIFTGAREWMKTDLAALSESELKLLIDGLDALSKINPGRK